MILKKDINREYNHQLTDPVKKKKDLDFATKQFKTDENVHCIVKYVEESDAKTGFAVFTTGVEYDS